jgi:hypothetical protein
VSGDPDPQPSPSEAERRRKRAEIFGDVLPETSADERSEPWNEPDSTGAEWLRQQVPPHHT